MGAFNTVQAECDCPICGKIGLFEIQFKYGDTWQHSYSVGDLLKWGGNDVGQKNVKKVRIESIGGPCPNCGSDFLECDVFVTDNRIENVIIVGENRSDITRDGFEVLE